MLINSYRLGILITEVVTMNKWILNHQFYKTINFWLGLFLIITNAYEIIQYSHISFSFILDVIILIAGVILMLSSLFRGINKE